MRAELRLLLSLPSLPPLADASGAGAKTAKDSEAEKVAGFRGPADVATKSSHYQKMMVEARKGMRKVLALLLMIYYLHCRYEGSGESSLVDSLGYANVSWNRPVGANAKSFETRKLSQPPLISTSKNILHYCLALA